MMVNGLTAGSENEALLDNPIWNSLCTGHAGIAIGADVGRGLARRYPHAVGPLSGMLEQTDDAYADLAMIVPEGDVAVLFLQEAAKAPAGWEMVRDGSLVQMICREVPEAAGLAEAIVPLTDEDVAEMVALATLTEPGPFREGTATLGGFVGIRVDGRLAAMAGERLSPTGFKEISAVCTHPDFRGRGYARALVAKVARNIYSDGRVPFLTALAGNVGAIRVYEQLGFVVRREFELAVLKSPAVVR
jgi:ribosomal protein S18 acetylase RimI-like enzyme